MTRSQVPPEPPIDLLLEGSKELLIEYELKRWNLVSKLKRERDEIQDEIDRLTSEALEALWLRKNREALLKFGAGLPIEPQKVFPKKEAKQETG